MADRTLKGLSKVCSEPIRAHCSLLGFYTHTCLLMSSSSFYLVDSRSLHLTWSADWHAFLQHDYWRSWLDPSFIMFPNNALAKCYILSVKNIRCFASRLSFCLGLVAFLGRDCTKPVLALHVLIMSPTKKLSFVSTCSHEDVSYTSNLHLSEDEGINCR